MPPKPTSASAKKARLIVLRIPPKHLAQFPSDQPALNDSSSTPMKLDPSPSVQPPELADKSSDSNATPVQTFGNDDLDSSLLVPPDTDGKKKKGGGAGITGRKRAPPSIDPNAPPRERGRPGPKKKPRLADGTIDRTTDKRGGPVAGASIVPAHKLGPKAHTGPINAGLRALDRTGKPCRKWERKSLVLKSFTGLTWGMNTWKAPPRDSSISGDVKGDSTGSSEIKPTQESSVVASDRSNSGAISRDVVMNGIGSSPAPLVGA